jgi:GrpB-like predicted nucleotidyltransferase (UPF0157 family)
VREHAGSPPEEDGRLLIVDYDPGWPVLFERLRERLLEVLDYLAEPAEHVGSTAVPGLAARPVLEADIVLRWPENLSPAVERLTELAYEFGYRNLPMPGLVARR